VSRSGARVGLAPGVPASSGISRVHHPLGEEHPLSGDVPDRHEDHR
jgi:hypothetical protein